MGYMNEFPHSRMFDSDLREIIEMFVTVKELPEQWEAYKELINGEVNGLKKFVNEYFDNLDVQNEINKKIDKLVADGTMAEVVVPIVNGAFKQVEDEFRNKLNSIGEVTVTDVLDTLSALQTRYPNGSSGIFVVVDESAWYYYKNGWIRGGDYTLSSLTEYAVKPLNLNSNFWKNYSGIPRVILKTGFIKKMSAWIETHIFENGSLYVPCGFNAEATSGSGNTSFVTATLQTPFNFDGNFTDDVCVCVNVEVPTHSRGKIYLSSGNSISSTRSWVSTASKTLKKGMNYFYINKDTIKDSQIVDGKNQLGVVLLSLSYPTISDEYFNCEIFVIDNTPIAAINQKSTNAKGGIVVWGDSLSAGSGSYAYRAAEILGVECRNYALGGENEHDIACRQGGSAYVIPPNTKLNTNNSFILTDYLGGYIRPVHNYRATDVVNPISVDGLYGTISRNDDGTVTIDGLAGYSKPYPLEIHCNGSDDTESVTIFWVGQNGDHTFESISKYLDLMIAHLKTTNYVVLGIPTGTASGRAELESKMLEHYGSKYLNTRDLLSKYGMSIVGLAIGEQDATDIAVGRIPVSLRYDNVHLNEYGHIALSELLVSKLYSLGYNFYM